MNSIATPLFKSNNAPDVSVVDITPEIARNWLSRNTGNRPLSPKHVAKLEKAIKAGDWKMTGDAVRFSKTGKLIDGQHRLHAILNSGITVTCVVMHGLDDEVFDVLDSGKSRQKSDVLFVELGLPVETCKLLASSAGWIIDYELGQYGFGGKADKLDVLAFVNANPAAIAAAEYAQALPRNTPVPRSIAAMFYFFASRRNPAAAERFLERFMVGAVDGASDNLLFLRNKCFSASVSRRPLPRTHVIAALVRIWNAEQRGAPIKHDFNATRPARPDENYPTFI